MFWKAEYNDYGIKPDNYRINPDVANYKEQVLRKVLNTLEIYPYATANLYKYSGDKKIPAGTYEYDVEAWNNKGIRRLKLMSKS